MILMWIGCVQYFDISSAVLVTTEDGMVVESTGSQFCHRLHTNYSTKDIPEYSVDACATTDIVNGVAELPNWEGEYRGEVTSIELWWMKDDSDIDAILLDTDEDVWCDNVDVDTDMNGNTTRTPYCASNFELYLLWSLKTPESE